MLGLQSLTGPTPICAADGKVRRDRGDEVAAKDDDASNSNSAATHDDSGDGQW